MKCLFCDFKYLNAIRYSRKGYWNLALLSYMELYSRSGRNCGLYCHIDDDLWKELESLAYECGINLNKLYKNRIFLYEYMRSR